MNVRRYLGIALTVLSALTSSGWADDVDPEDLGSENIQQPAKEAPFAFSVDFDTTDKAEINSGFFKGDKIRFAVAEAQLYGVFYYCPAYAEGANVAVSYIYTAVDWPGNPWFEQNHFNTLRIALGGFTKRLCRWFWQGKVDINIDADQWNLNEYATYDLVLWGRYTYCDHIGIHIGIIAETGMQMDRVYPILGADWRMSRHWKLNVVFPVNVSLEYLLNNNWSFAVAGRNFNTRQRVSPHESSPKSVIRYENVGAELAIKYEQDGMSANVHAGTTLGGRLRVANRHNDHPHSYKLDPTPYAGAEVVVRF